MNGKFCRQDRLGVGALNMLNNAINFYWTNGCDDNIQIESVDSFGL